MSEVLKCGARRHQRAEEEEGGPDRDLQLLSDELGAGG